VPLHFRRLIVSHWRIGIRIRIRVRSRRVASRRVVECRSLCAIAVDRLRAALGSHISFILPLPLPRLKCTSVQRCVCVNLALPCLSLLNCQFVRAVPRWPPPVPFASPSPSPFPCRIRVLTASAARTSEAMRKRSSIHLQLSRRFAFTVLTRSVRIAGHPFRY
jgi:hypothetical protein